MKNLNLKTLVVQELDANELKANKGGEFVLTLLAFTATGLVTGIMLGIGLKIILDFKKN